MQQQPRTPQQAISELEAKDKDFFEWVAKLEITDDASQKNAENLLASGKFSLKRAKGIKEFLLEPIKESKKRVESICDPYIGRVQDCINAITKALSDYVTEKERIAKEELAYQEAEIAAKVAESQETGELVDIPGLKIGAPAKRSSSDLATTSYIDAFDIVIINPDLVPRDLCDPTMSKIRKRVESGVKFIPGVQITSKKTLRTTPKKA